MKHLSPLFFVCMLLVLPFSGNANDCNSATNLTSVVLTSQGEVSDSFSGSSWSGTAQCAGPGEQNDRWFSFTAQASRSFIRVTPTGNIDAAIEVYDACGGALIACVNNAGAGAIEIATLTGLQSGEQYFFSVYHASGDVLSSEEFDVVVAHIPQIELRSQDCDQFNYNTNQIIRATQPGLTSFTVTGYQWRFEELEAPFNVYEVISPNGTNPNYRLLWLSGIQYGRTYNVSVRLLVSEASSVGDYGNVCSIGLQPNVLSTQLQSQFANQFFNFCDVVGADAVGGASHYRWEFNDLNTVSEVFGDGNSRLLRLQKVPGLRLGQTYIVSAFATVNGDESPAGTFRFLNMNNFVPNTGLRQDVYPCGQSYPFNSFVQAVEVCSAESYTWRFTNTSQSQPAILYTRSDGSRFIRLDWLSDLIIGDSYNVEVRAAQGTLLGDYSTICNITIGPIISGVQVDPSGDELTVVDASEAFFQPESGDPFAVKIAGNDGSANDLLLSISNPLGGQVQMELFDLSGKLVAKKMDRIEGQQTVQWNLPALNRGIYLLRSSNGQDVVSHKVLR